MVRVLSFHCRNVSRGPRTADHGRCSPGCRNGVSTLNRWMYALNRAVEGGYPPRAGWGVRKFLMYETATIFFFWSGYVLLQIKHECFLKSPSLNNPEWFEVGQNDQTKIQMEIEVQLENSQRVKVIQNWNLKFADCCPHEVKPQLLWLRNIACSGDGWNLTADWRK